MSSAKKEIFVVSGVVIGVYLLAMLAGISCPILFVTGIPCPGCGMTRAWVQFFRGNIREAFRFHPLFPLPVVLLGLWPLKGRMSNRMWNGVMAALIFLVLSVWLLRFFLPEDPVVHLDFSHSLVGKLFLAE